ncbi:MAG: holo-ACP synthase [Bacteroidales bacterium]|nr:holo-ACP synthase [Bacteroidales bacterium]
MIAGLGTDIIEVSRVKEQLLKDEGFVNNIFTSSEIEYCESKKNKAENFAARYAAKEAFFKALGTGWRYGMTFKEIEIINDELGKPEIIVSGKVKEFIDKTKVINIHVSLSHLKDIVNAIVILEK